MSIYDIWENWPKKRKISLALCFVHVLIAFKSNFIAHLVLTGFFLYWQWHEGRDFIQQLKNLIFVFLFEFSICGRRWQILNIFGISRRLLKIPRIWLYKSKNNQHKQSKNINNKLRKCQEIGLERWVSTEHVETWGEQRCEASLAGTVLKSCL